jgi:Spy/CpxP family protein refolding chaperone
MRHIVPVLLIALAAATVQAQPFGPPPGPHNMERIEHLKKVRLVEMLDLKEEQSVRFFARLNEHENTMRSLGSEKSDLLDRIERLVRNEADVKEFEAIFPQMSALEDRVGAERKRFFDGLADLLTPEQRGKLLLFERQFERELREAMKEVRQRRNRGDGE